MTKTKPKEITNADRAERCHSALEIYHDEHDVRSNLIDLLADARHWCDGQGENYAELDRLGYQHYIIERDTETWGRP